MGLAEGRVLEHCHIKPYQVGRLRIGEVWYFTSVRQTTQLANQPLNSSTTHYLVVYRREGLYIDAEFPYRPSILSWFSLGWPRPSSAASLYTGYPAALLLSQPELSSNVKHAYNGT